MSRAFSIGQLPDARSRDILPTEQTPVDNLQSKPATTMTSLPTLSHGDYTVGWICALPTEMAAARAMLDEHHNPLQQNSHNRDTYTPGRVGRHNVVLACHPTRVIGTLSAPKVAN